MDAGSEESFGGEGEEYFDEESEEEDDDANMRETTEIVASDIDDRSSETG